MEGSGLKGSKISSSKVGSDFSNKKITKNSLKAVGKNTLSSEDVSVQRKTLSVKECTDQNLERPTTNANIHLDENIRKSPKLKVRVPFRFPFFNKRKTLNFSPKKILQSCKSTFKKTEHNSQLDEQQAKVRGNYYYIPYRPELFAQIESKYREHLQQRYSDISDQSSQLSYNETVSIYGVCFDEPQNNSQLYFEKPSPQVLHKSKNSMGIDQGPSTSTELLSQKNDMPTRKIITGIKNGDIHHGSFTHDDLPPPLPPRKGPSTSTELLSQKNDIPTRKIITGTKNGDTHHGSSTHNDLSPPLPPRKGPNTSTDLLSQKNDIPTRINITGTKNGDIHHGSSTHDDLSPPLPPRNKIFILQDKYNNIADYRFISANSYFGAIEIVMRDPKFSSDRYELLPFCENDTDYEATEENWEHEILV